GAMRACAARGHGPTVRRGLAEALRPGPPHLTEQLGERQAALPAARVGHDAVGAELVAAALRRDPRPDTRFALGLEVAVGLVAIEPHVRRRLTRRAPQEIGEVAMAV